jgi:peptidoglycan hydrolase-like protein with peptidoglycan-binding domain
MDGRINTIKAIQAVLGVTQDGIFGPESQSALDNLVNSPAQAPGSPYSASEVFRPSKVAKA